MIHVLWVSTAEVGKTTSARRIVRIEIFLDFIAYCKLDGVKNLSLDN